MTTPKHPRLEFKFKEVAKGEKRAIHAVVLRGDVRIGCAESAGFDPGSQGCREFALFTLSNNLTYLLEMEDSE